MVQMVNAEVGEKSLAVMAESAPAKVSASSFSGYSTGYMPAYEGGGYTQQTAMWTPQLQTPDYEISVGRDLAVARSRELNRNAPTIASGIREIQDHIAGSRFRLNAKPEIDVLPPFFREIDEDGVPWDETFQTETEGKFRLYAESPKFFIDAEGRKSLTDIIRLCLSSVTLEGEVFLSIEWVTEGRRPYATAIQVIDNDRISNPDWSPDSKHLKGGIEFDARGKAVAYHIRTEHPSEVLGDTESTWKRVAAENAWGRQQIIHVYDEHRPGQTRGIAALVSALSHLHMMRHLDKATLQSTVLKAMLAVSIESDLPMDKIVELLGGNAEGIDEQIGLVGEAMMGNAAAFNKGASTLAVDGAVVPHLYPGTRLNAKQVGGDSPIGSGFEASLLRKVASILGLSYEELSRDFTQTTYSSARAAMSQTYRAMMSLKSRVADRIADAIYRAWLEEAIGDGKLECMPKWAIGDWLYEGQNLDALANAEWIGASRGQIDEKKETDAAIKRIGAGLSTRGIEAAKLGLDFREIDRQAERENRSALKRGLRYTTAVMFEEEDDDDDMEAEDEATRARNSAA
ncbi:phage portal protein [Paracoccus sp. S4493]|uniref:phage portal protein n=1 Tax=Paracoccus sp. S4493 TaxID=579490 RepID=UPI00069774C8|nr:phage portal protein [Paracoccus sp. S4493]